MIRETLKIKREKTSAFLRRERENRFRVFAFLIAELHASNKILINEKSIYLKDSLYNIESDFRFFNLYSYQLILFEKRRSKYFFSINMEENNNLKSKDTDGDDDLMSFSNESSTNISTKISKITNQIKRSKTKSKT